MAAVEALAGVAAAAVDMCLIAWSALNSRLYPYLQAFTISRIRTSIK